MMKRKIICICVIALVTLGSLSTILVTNKVNAENPPGQASGMFPYNYMWFNITKTLADVITNNEIYPKNENIVRKGRAFGSAGDHWAADFLKNRMNDDLHLENVTKLRLGPIKKSGFIQPYRKWFYTSFLNITNLSLTINHNNYSYPSPVPKNETFALAGYNNNNILWTEGYGNMTYNREFDHVRVFEKNISKDHDTYGDLLDMFGGRYTGVYLNVSNCIALNEFYEVVAKVMYVHTREDLPVDQEGTLFLIDENESCQAIVDNVTSNASGILLIHNSSKSSYSASVENVSVRAARTTSDEQNLTEVVDLLQNDTFIIADNINDNETITFQYDFEDVDDSALSYDRVYLT